MVSPRRQINRLLTLIISFGLWESASFFAGAKYFPHLWRVMPDLISLLVTTSFWSNLLLTLWLSVLSFIIGTICATTIGVLIALKRSGELATRGVLNFFRSIPSVVFLPLLIASIGSSARTSVILAAFVVTFMLVTYVIRGVGTTATGLLDSSKIMGLPWVNKIFLLYLPSTISIAGTGLRLSASRAFGTIVAAGIVAGTPGIGSSLLIAESNANYPRVFSYVLIMGVVGTVIYSLFTSLEKKLVHWRIAV